MRVRSGWWLSAVFLAFFPVLGNMGCSSCRSCCDAEEQQVQTSDPLSIGIAIRGREKLIHKVLYRGVQDGVFGEDEVLLAQAKGGENAWLKAVSITEPLPNEKKSKKTKKTGSTWKPAVRKKLAALRQMMVRGDLDCTFQPLEMVLRMILSSPETMETTVMVAAQIGSTESRVRSKRVVVRDEGAGLGDPPFKGRSIAIIEGPIERYQLGQLLEVAGVSIEEVTVLAEVNPMRFRVHLQNMEPDLALVGSSTVKAISGRGFSVVERSDLQVGLPVADLLVCNKKLLESEEKTRLLETIVEQLDDLVGAAEESPESTDRTNAKMRLSNGTTARPDAAYLANFGAKLTEAGLLPERFHLESMIFPASESSPGDKSPDGVRGSNTNPLPDSRMDKDAPE